MRRKPAKERVAEATVRDSLALYVGGFVASVLDELADVDVRLKRKPFFARMVQISVSGKLDGRTVSCSHVVSYEQLADWHIAEVLPAAQKAAREFSEPWRRLAQGGRE